MASEGEAGGGSSHRLGRRARPVAKHNAHDILRTTSLATVY